MNIPITLQVTLQKSEKAIADLEKKLADATGNEAKKIRQKIINIKQTARKKKKGTEDTRSGKRN